MPHHAVHEMRGTAQRFRKSPGQMQERGLLVRVIRRLIDRIEQPGRQNDPETVAETVDMNSVRALLTMSMTCVRLRSPASGDTGNQVKSRPNMLALSGGQILRIRA